MCEEDYEDIEPVEPPYIVAGNVGKNNRIVVIPIINELELDERIEVEANDKGEFTVDLSNFKEPFDIYDKFKIEVIK